MLEGQFLTPAVSKVVVSSRRNAQFEKKKRAFRCGEIAISKTAVSSRRNARFAQKYAFRGDETLLLEVAVQPESTHSLAVSRGPVCEQRAWL